MVSKKKRMKKTIHGYALWYDGELCDGEYYSFYEKFPKSITAGNTMRIEKATLVIGGRGNYDNLYCKQHAKMVTEEQEDETTE